MLKLALEVAGWGVLVYRLHHLHGDWMIGDRMLKEGEVNWRLRRFVGWEVWSRSRVQVWQYRFMSFMSILDRRWKGAAMKN